MDDQPENQEEGRRELVTPEPTPSQRDRDSESRGRPRSRRLRSRGSAGRARRSISHRPRSGGRRRSRTRTRTRSRSRSCHLRRRERELELERRRIYRLERELQRDREGSRRHHSRRSSRRDDGQHSERRSLLLPMKTNNTEPLPTGSRRGEHADDAGQSPQRSRSPTFTTKDVLSLLQSLKSGFPAQPVTQSAHLSHKGLDHHNIVPGFDPSAKNQRIDVWLKKVNECASVYGWDERTTIHFAMQKLQGLAKTWYESLSTILYSWPQWQEKLISAFPCEQNYGQSLEDMLKRRSRFGEPIEAYFYEKLALLNQCDIHGKRAVDCIIHGINDKTVKSSALALRCTEPDQLLQFLLSSKETISSHSNVPFRNRSNVAISDGSHNSRTGAKQFTNSVFCFNCKDKGHIFTQCPKPLIKCKRCNKVGHVTENCFSKDKTNLDPVQKTMCISSSNHSAKFIKRILVNGAQLDAFVDLGSEVTLVKESVMKHLGIEHDNQPTQMRGFGNSLVQSLGSVSLHITIDRVDATVPCRVVNDDLLEKSILIGQSFSEQPHVVVYKDASELRFLRLDTFMPGAGLNDDQDELPLRIRVSKHSELYGSATIKAKTEPSFTGDVLLCTKVVGKPDAQYIISGGVYRVKEGNVCVTITPCSIPCSLLENSIFSRAERIEIVNRIAASVSLIDDIEGGTRSQIDKEHVLLGESVSEGDKTRLFNLLDSYKNCFAKDLGSLGCTNTTEMNIELTSQRPVVYRPYRLSHHERDKVRQMVGDMLDAGIIRESVSSYASPIILVKKKDGTARMCVDYRMLNSITVKERYPMPLIEDEIARLSGQACFVTLDLMSGYYQVPISEKSKHLTAFVTPDGQYEFNRMPFGLANAPAVFQRMMNHVLGPVRFNKATVYIDDLLIYGKDADECLNRLEEVLQILEKANLKLNLCKCSFLMSKIDYLGYEISANGMRPGETKIKSVLDFPRPDNVHGVRQFLGLVSYFRKFIYGFAVIASPLTKLLKKEAKWEWAEPQESAFTTLKDRLINRPVLAIFNPQAEIELHTDASRVGVGGILLQRAHDCDSFKAVAYYSRQTTPEEKNFHSYELETLAVVTSLKKFRVFLLGQNFKVVTDCSALRSTFQKRDLVPRIARWWLALQEFDCSIEYRAGNKMSHVDALSRNPVNSFDNQDPEPFPAVMTISDQDWLLTLQLGDSEIRRIREILRSRLDEKGLEYIKDNYVIQDNKLFRYVNGDKDILRWVVPKGARWQVCKLNHDDIGHVGYEKTLDRIKSRYWFSKMTRFIKKYVNSCIECAYAKKTASSREGLLHPINKVEKPFHTLHIDHLGPFVKSKRGYTHLLVAVDSFTKFVFIKPVRNTNTQNAIKVLEDIFDTFRTPERLVSDRGSCFTSHAFRTFCLSRGIKHVLNAVASPRSNGQVERYNRTILDSLTAQNLKFDERDWDNKLGRIQWGLNNTIQKTTGRAPAEILFGTSMSSEKNPILNEISDETREVVNLAELRSEVKERIDREQINQKRHYDKGRRPARTYNKGDLVKVTKTAFNNNGKSTKLMPVYEGPYRVAKILGNDRYKLAPIPGFEGMRNKRKTTVASDRMQPWIHVSALEMEGNSDDENEVGTVNDDTTNISNGNDILTE